MREKINIENIMNVLVVIFSLLMFTKLKILNVLLPFMLICFAIKIKKTGYKKTGYELPILLFVSTIALSLIDAYNVSFGFKMFQRTLRFLLLPLILGQFEFKEKIKRNVLIGSILGVIYILILGILNIKGYIPYLYGDRVSGGIELWIYGEWLSFGIAILLGSILYLVKNTKIKVILGLLLILNLYILLLSKARSGYVAATAVILSMLFIKYGRKLLIPLGIGFLIFGVIVIKNPTNNYVQTVKSIANVKTNASNIGRLEIWSQGIEAFKKHPINGVGWRNFQEIEDPSKYSSGKETYNHLHQSQLTILMGTGILGFIAYVYMITFIVFSLYRKKDYFALITMGLFIASEFYGLTESSIRYHEIQRIIYFFLGISISGIYISKKNKKD
jgi:O-antigen ligase